MILHTFSRIKQRWMLFFLLLFARNEVRLKMFSTLTRQNTYGLVFRPQPLRNVCLLKDNKTPATPLTSLSYQKKSTRFLL